MVGVVRDSRYWALGEEMQPTICSPVRQAYAGEMTPHVRTADFAGTAERIGAASDPLSALKRE